MHYKDEDLYFYLKEGGKNQAISAHLAECEECSLKTERAKKITGLFAAAMENPPSLRSNPAPKAAHGFFAGAFLKPVLTAALSITVLFSGALLVKKHLGDKNTAVPAFVYETYSTIYDFDYYKTNYMDNTKIQLTGGAENETF